MVRRGGPWGRGGDEERIEKESAESSNWDSLRIEDSSSDDIILNDNLEEVGYIVCVDLYLRGIIYQETGTGLVCFSTIAGQSYFFLAFPTLCVAQSSVLLD